MLLVRRLAFYCHFFFAQFIFSPIAGNLSDKHGRKKIIIIGLIIFGLSQLAFGLSTELWMLFVARFFSGFGAAFIVPPTMAFVADITSYEKRGKRDGTARRLHVTWLHDWSWQLVAFFPKLVWNSLSILQQEQHLTAALLSSYFYQIRNPSSLKGIGYKKK